MRTRCLGFEVITVPIRTIVFDDRFEAQNEIVDFGNTFSKAGEVFDECLNFLHLKFEFLLLSEKVCDFAFV